MYIRYLSPPLSLNINTIDIAVGTRSIISVGSLFTTHTHEL
jgi:hypothetical protein